VCSGFLNSVLQEIIFGSDLNKGLYTRLPGRDLLKFLRVFEYLRHFSLSEIAFLISVRLGLARLGSAWLASAWFGLLGPGSVWLGLARLGPACLGLARLAGQNLIPVHLYVLTEDSFYYDFYFVKRFARR